MSIDVWKEANLVIRSHVHDIYVLCYIPTFHYLDTVILKKAEKKKYTPTKERYLNQKQKKPARDLYTRGICILMPDTHTLSIP